MQNDCFPATPPEWEKGPISMIADINPRYPIKKGQECPFIEMAAVAEHFGGIQRMDWRKLEGSGLARFKVGDTLFAKITPCPENGKVAFVHELPASYGIGSTEFIVLSPKANCDPRYLYHLVCAHAVRGRAASRMEGSTGRQRVPDDVFEKRLLVPIPHPKEQSGIAEVLDAVDDTIAKSMRGMVEARSLLRALQQRFFFDALGETAYADRPTKQLPCGWQLLPTASLLSAEPKNGVSPRAFTQPPGTPTFSIAAIREGRIDLEKTENLKYAHIPDKAADAYRVQRGDVLIVRGNANPDLVGKAGMIDSFPSGCIYPDITKRVTFKSGGAGTVSPEFAVIAWNHSVVHNQVLRRAKTSNGTLKINNRDVKEIVMPVPPPDEQAAIVDLVKAAEDRIDTFVRIIAAQGEIKRALLHDLLTGTVRVKANNSQVAEAV